jgi:hypothetical protein
MDRKGLVVMALVSAVFLVLSAGLVLAGDDAPPPPYQVNKANGIGVNVVFDAAVVRSVLPPGIEPVEEMTGGINLYTAEEGYGLGPYSAFYLYVNIKGFDSADGTKGRWMLQAFYGGPETKVSEALHKYYGLPVRAGESRRVTKDASTVGMGTFAGQELVRLVVTPKPAACKSVAGTLNYPGQLDTSREIVVWQAPYVGEICEADPVSVDITAPADDPLSKLKPVKILGAIAAKNFAFAIPRPVSAQQVKAQAARAD